MTFKIICFLKTSKNDLSFSIFCVILSMVLPLRNTTKALVGRCAQFLNASWINISGELRSMIARTRVGTLCPKLWEFTADSPTLEIFRKGHLCITSAGFSLEMLRNYCSVSWLVERVGKKQKSVQIGFLAERHIGFLNRKWPQNKYSNINAIYARRHWFGIPRTLLQTVCMTVGNSLIQSPSVRTRIAKVKPMTFLII